MFQMVMPTNIEQKSGQPSVLRQALAKLQGLQLDNEQVKRVAVGRQGVLHIEVHEADAQRFFVYEANGLRELQPENDPKIPLLAKLREDDFAAEHTLISYRPGRRIVLGPVRGRHDTIVKGYRKHQAALPAEKYTCAASACQQGGFDVPELLQYQPDRDCLVIAKRAGLSPGFAADAVGSWSLIGSCLRRFQQFETPDGLQAFNIQDELAVLDERARRFKLVMPALPRHWQRDRGQLEQVAVNLPPVVKGLAHRDLHDGQFIIAGQRISLLDFDLLCCADVALDAGNLLAHMQLREFQGQQKNASAACSKAFLTGMGRQNQQGFERRLLFYQASTFYRLALLYALRPRWAHLTGVLIAAGKRCIDALNETRGKA